MEKITVITGPARSGKTRKAKKMAAKYKENEVEFIPIRKRPFMEEAFFLGQCTEKTKLIIIDDVIDIYSFKKLISIFFMDAKLKINDKGKRPFYIDRPEIIITCDEAVTCESIEWLPVSYTERINLVRI